MRVGSASRRSPVIGHLDDPHHFSRQRPAPGPGLSEDEVVFCVVVRGETEAVVHRRKPGSWSPVDITPPDNPSETLSVHVPALAQGSSI